MQTFLPYECFEESALALDKKRCWKQVVEAKQIIEILEKKRSKAWGHSYNGVYYTNLYIPWENHPAVLMWMNNIPTLRYYFNVFLGVCKDVHNTNTEYEPDTNSDLKAMIRRMDKGYEMNGPWWLGNENFHRAMRARLIEKDPAFYLPKFPQDQGFNGGKYFWPDMKTNTFKII